MIISFNPPRFNGIDSAWRGLLRHIVSSGTIVDGVMDPDSIGSAFGTALRPTIEKTATSFILSNPRQRVTKSSFRKFDIAFAIANFFWFLSGDSRLDMICRYNSKGLQFSSDGLHLPTAFGFRARNSDAGDQLTSAVELLKRDPTTRRAVITISDPTDVVAPGRDVPCAVSVQFLRREGRLDCITHMRSQSVLMVLPYDLFLFTMLHEIVSSELEIEIGEYIHFCGSAHVYLDELSVATAVIGESEVAAPQMSAMPLHSLSLVPAILNAERAIRNFNFSIASSVSASDGKIDYWTNLLLVLARSLDAK